MNVPAQGKTVVRFEIAPRSIAWILATIECLPTAGAYGGLLAAGIAQTDERRRTAEVNRAVGRDVATSVLSS